MLQQTGTKKWLRVFRRPLIFGESENDEVFLSLNFVWLHSGAAARRGRRRSFACTLRDCSAKSPTGMLCVLVSAACPCTVKHPFSFSPQAFVNVGLLERFLPPEWFVQVCLAFPDVNRSCSDDKVLLLSAAWRVLQELSFAGSSFFSVTLNLRNSRTLCTYSIL